MIQLYSTEVGPENQKRILNLVAAYPYLLRQHIRPGCLCSDKEIPDPHRLLLQEQRRVLHETRHEGQDEGEGVAVSSNSPDCWVDKRALPWSLFLPQSLPAIARAENRPLWVCDRMAALIAKIPYGPNFTSRERLTLLGMVDKLTNAVGQCERIHQTAVPLNYARHSLRSLTLWLFTLPFALVQDLGLFAAPANAMIAWLLYGIYQIGYSIEDPFQGSLRLSILCDAIRRSVVRQATDMRDSAYQLDDYDAESSDETTEQQQLQPNNAHAFHVNYEDQHSSLQQLPEDCLTGISSSSSSEECVIVDAIRRSVKAESHGDDTVKYKQQHEDTMKLTASIESSMTKPLQLQLLPEEGVTKSLQQEIRQQLSSPKNSNKDSTITTLSLEKGTSSQDQQQLPESLLQDDLLPEPLLIDEQVLDAPKFVLRRNNGTWVEVGI